MSSELILAIVVSLATTLIGTATVCIAWQQWQTHRRKVAMDLFDRRFKVYSKVEAFIFEVLGGVHPSFEESIYKFMISTKSALFLFGPEIPEFIEEIRVRAIELLDLKKKLDSNAFQTDQEVLLRRQLAVKEWFQEQIDIACRFKKYLDLSKI